MGTGSQGAPGRVGSRRKPAGVGAEQWSGGSPPAERSGRPVVGAARRAGSAPRPRILGQHALCRRERPDRRLRLRRRRSDQPAHRGGGPARRQESRSRRRICARAEERRRRPGWRGVLLHRLDGQRHRRRPHREPAAGHHHADPARRRAGPAVRNGRAQRHGPCDRARRLGVDCGQQPRQRREPDRPARSPPTTSTTIRPRPSPGSQPGANWVGPTAIPMAVRPTCR